MEAKQFAVVTATLVLLFAIVGASVFGLIVAMILFSSCVPQ
jgi:hypothetical protein